MKKLLIVVLVCMVCSVSANADVIAEYDFGADLAATTVGANVTVSDIGFGSGITAGDAARSATAGGCLYARCSTTGIGDLAGAITDVDYVTFTIDVDAGYVMDLTSMTLEQGYTNNTGFFPKFVAVDLLTSVDGFTADDGVYYHQNDIPTPSTGGTTVFYDSLSISELSGAEFQGLTGSVEFRFYLTDDTNSRDIIHRLDDIVLNGTVSLSFPTVDTRTPANGSTGLPLDQTLDWTLFGSVEDYVDVYFVIDPNFYLVDSSNAAGTYDPAPLAYGTTYYWTLVTYDPGGGTPVPHPSEPVWWFTTEVENPRITGDPVGQTVVAGTEVTLSVTASNATAYQWFKDGVEITSETSSSLVLSSVQLADEAGYHCEAYNASYPSTNVHPDAISAAARVMTRRLAGWWKLDGDLTDSVATVVTGAPAHDGASVVSNYVTGLIGDGIDLTGDPNQLVGITGDPDVFNFYPQGYTVSTWIQVAPESGGWGPAVAKDSGANGNGGSDAGFRLDCHGSPIHTLRGPGSVYSQIDTGDGGWHLVTGSYDRTTGSLNIYIDGAIANSSTSAAVPSGNTDQLVFGCTNVDAIGNVPINPGQAANTYKGLLDEIKIYTYALTPEQVADEYQAVFPGEVLCIYPDFFGVEFDVAGGPVDGEGNPTPDCQVTLVDFAEFAGAWLGSGLYPAP